MSTIRVTNLKHESSASNNVVLDSSGRALIGTSSARANMFNSVATSTLQLEAVSATTGAGRLSVVYNDNSADSTSIILGKSRATTVGGSTAVQSGDALGSLCWQGADGSELVEAARIIAEVDGTPGANDMPGRLVFSTTSDGSDSPTERMRLDSSGNLKFNSGYGSVATAYGVRAWVNFNGTSTVAIRASGNVSSITDNGTGDYTVNFTTALVDSDYSVAGQASYPTQYIGIIHAPKDSTPRNTGSLRVGTFYINGNQADMTYVDIQIVR